MSNAWFRMYHEFATDPKVQMLSECDQRRYIMILCMRCSNGYVTLQDEEVAFQLRISNEEWQKTRSNLLNKNLIDDNNMPCNWDKRQYVSDSSAARVARHREKKKSQPVTPCNVTVTPPDTDTDTDTELKNTSAAQSVSKQKKSKPDYPEWFENLWKVYPPRAGSNDKRKAFQAANARIKSGKSEKNLFEAVFRYSKFLKANGNLNSQFVMQAATFFGPGEHIENPWEIQQKQFNGLAGPPAIRRNDPRAIPVIEQLTDTSWAK